MSNINLIQNKIMQLEGGAFQKLFDEYLYKKYKFKNIQKFKKIYIKKIRIIRLRVYKISRWSPNK